MPIKHWSHNFANIDKNLFGCNIVATNGWDMAKKFILFIIGLILIPVLVIIVPIISGILFGSFIVGNVI